MPSDSLKSIVYRSFVTCDDPSGVVDCKTIRKSKNVSHRTEGKVENVKSAKNLVTSSHKEETQELSSKGSGYELGRSSSVQLEEVSKGAQKLSKVVDSFSQGSLDRHSEDIAKDLLRGALSLQESLLMLGKLQEASKFMANFKKKQKEKTAGGKSDPKGLQRSYSERFGNQNNVIEFQKPRLSADGSSRDCYEELREVIKESFARQNILAENSPDETGCSDGKLDLSPDSASGSSSQSSLFNSHDFASSESSSSNLLPEKPKGSNLIAKLMGLEEFPSKSMHSTTHKQSEKGWLLNNKRAISDIDLPTVRRPSFIVQKAKPEQRTLGEIIEIMQFKGLMKDEAFDGSQERTYHKISDFPGDAPPIVLIKPMPILGIEKQMPYVSKCTCGGKDSDTEEMLKLWKIKEKVQLKRLDPQQGVLSSAEIQRKFRADKNMGNRLSHEKTRKQFVEAIARPSGESLVKNNQALTKSKASDPASFKHQKVEVIEKRIDKIERLSPKTKKAGEKNQTTEPNSKRSIVAKPNNQGNVNSTKVSNSRGSLTTKTQVSQQKSNIFNPTSRSRSTTVLPNTGSRRKNVKNGKPAAKQSAIVAGSINHKNASEVTDINLERKADKGEARVIPSEKQSCKEVRDPSDHEDDPNILSESTSKIVQQHCDIICDQSDSIDVNFNLTATQNSKSRNAVRDILLSNVTFINHAEELFDTTSGQNVILEEATLHDCKMEDAKLILACANELLECKSQEWGLTVYPLLQHPMTRSKISISFDDLLARICDGIENLKYYNKLSGDTLLVDSLYAVLKRDLWRNGVVSGAWDLGWKNGFTSDEVELVVDDIEELVFSGVIEDLLLDLLL